MLFDVSTSRDEFPQSVHHIRGHERGEPDGRPEREVDLAGAQDEHDRDSHHRHRRRLTDDVEQVRPSQKALPTQRRGEVTQDELESQSAAV